MIFLLISLGRNATSITKRSSNVSVYIQAVHLHVFCTSNSYNYCMIIFQLKACFGFGYAFKFTRILEKSLTETDNPDSSVFRLILQTAILYIMTISFLCIYCSTFSLPSKLHNIHWYFFFFFWLKKHLFLKCEKRWGFFVFVFVKDRQHWNVFEIFEYSICPAGNRNSGIFICLMLLQIEKKMATVSLMESKRLSFCGLCVYVLMWM